MKGQRSQPFATALKRLQCLLIQDQEVATAGEICCGQRYISPHNKGSMRVAWPLVSSLKCLYSVLHYCMRNAYCIFIVIVFLLMHFNRTVFSSLHRIYTWLVLIVKCWIVIRSYKLKTQFWGQYLTTLQGHMHYNTFDEQRALMTPSMISQEDNGRGSTICVTNLAN